MAKTLNVPEVIKCTEEYIREVYNKTDIGKRGEPLTIRGSYDIRDLVLATLCSRAIGRDHIRVIFHSRPGARGATIYQIGIDYDCISIFYAYVKEITELYDYPINALSNIIDGTLRIHLFNETDHLNDGLIPRALGFIRDIATILSHPEPLVVAPFNFGEVLLFRGLYDKIRSEMSMVGSSNMYNILLPLISFTDEEVFLIGQYLGVNDLYSSLISPYCNVSFNYRDTPIERAIKLASSCRPNLNRLGQGNIINLMMDSVPIFTNAEVGIRDLTHFFMGECSACYENTRGHHE